MNGWTVSSAIILTRMPFSWFALLTGVAGIWSQRWFQTIFISFVIFHHVNRSSSKDFIFYSLLLQGSRLMLCDCNWTRHYNRCVYVCIMTKYFSSKKQKSFCPTLAKWWNGKNVQILLLVTTDNDWRLTIISSFTWRNVCFIFIPFFLSSPISIKLFVWFFSHSVHVRCINFSFQPLTWHSAFIDHFIEQSMYRSKQIWCPSSVFFSSLLWITFYWIIIIIIICVKWSLGCILINIVSFSSRRQFRLCKWRHKLAQLLLTN